MIGGDDNRGGNSGEKRSSAHVCSSCFQFGPALYKYSCRFRTRGFFSGPDFASLVRLFHRFSPSNEMLIYFNFFNHISYIRIYLVAGKEYIL